tara:strand:+ start:5730 stop:5942 length:213 start_codon:yes stop_codon:yes gene_type:complete
LSPEELVCLSFIINDATESYDLFDHPSIFEKLLDYFCEEMPYGVAKCRDEEPDVWMIRQLKNRYGVSDGL